jgi:hypothetical protein
VLVARHKQLGVHNLEDGGVPGQNLLAVLATASVWLVAKHDALLLLLLLLFVLLCCCVLCCGCDCFSGLRFFGFCQRFFHRSKAEIDDHDG